MDFSSDIDNLEEGLLTVAKGLLQHGVTSYCPTIVTSTQQSYNEVLEMLKNKTQLSYSLIDKFVRHFELLFVF